MAMAADPRTRGQLNLIGWTWLLHGALLILGVPVLAGMQALIGLIDGQLLASLPPPERAQIGHMQQLLLALAEAIPVMLVLGLLVLPPAIAFLRRARWGRAGIEVMTWLHLVLVFPSLAWWSLQLPPVLLQFDAAGQPIPAFGWLSRASHLLSTSAMSAMAIYLLILVRRPAIRAAFGSDAEASSSQS